MMKLNWFLQGGKEFLNSGNYFAYLRHSLDKPEIKDPIKEINAHNGSAINDISISNDDK
jgi:hypothetical protein